MDDFARLQFHKYKNVDGFEKQGVNRSEIASPDIGRMMLEKGSPVLT
jgi:hypothetical protein